MIILDLDIESVSIMPAEAYSPLVVDPDAELSFAVTMEFFQSVAGRHAEIAYFAGGIDEQELPIGESLQRTRKFPGELALEDLFRLLALETSYHGVILTQCVNVVKMNRLNRGTRTEARAYRLRERSPRNEARASLRINLKLRVSRQVFR